MAVKENFRGKGIAQKLLATLLKYSQKNKYTAIYLATSPNLVAANKFYIKEGFIKIEKLPKVIPVPIAPIYFMKNLIT